MQAMAEWVARRPEWGQAWAWDLVEEQEDLRSPARRTVTASRRRARHRTLLAATARRRRIATAATGAVAARPAPRAGTCSYLLKLVLSLSRICEHEHAPLVIFTLTISKNIIIHFIYKFTTHPLSLSNLRVHTNTCIYKV